MFWQSTEVTRILSTETNGSVCVKEKERENRAALQVCDDDLIILFYGLSDRNRKYFIDPRGKLCMLH